MAPPFRVTGPVLDLLEVLLDDPAQELHGWALMKSTKRSGPTVYQGLERLTRAGWLSSRWEDLNPAENRPRRRFYRLRPNALSPARHLLAERRPDALEGRMPSFEAGA